MKYKSCLIESTPKGTSFPDMVTIQKTTKKFKALLGKQYINNDKAVLAIDMIVANLLITNGKFKTNKELLELGMGTDIRW